MHNKIKLHVDSLKYYYSLIKCYLRKEQIFSLPFLVLLFPTLTVLSASTGFLFGIPVMKWQAVLAMLICIFLCLCGCSSAKQVLKRACAFLGILIAAYLINSLSVMFSTADAEWYHRSVTWCLANGWNPVFDSTAEQLVSKFGKGYSPWHAAYLPHGAGIWGACIYTITGFIEAGDSLDLLLMIVLGHLSWRVFKDIYKFNKGVNIVATTLILFTPDSIISLSGGQNDGLYYLLLMILVMSATLYIHTKCLRWGIYIIPAIALLCNIKYTGIVSSVVFIAVFTIVVFLRSLANKTLPKSLYQWLSIVTVSLILAMIIGFSPYITSWAKFGGPFYPIHSFNKEVKPINKITYDFDRCNEDAEQMGYLGRFCYAYLSKDLTLRYYKLKTGKNNFNPVIRVSGGVEGRGGIFRWALILSFIILLFNRKSLITPALIVIALTCLTQPATTVGYARYVPQMVAFPLIIVFDFIALNKYRLPQLYKSFILCILVLYSIILSAYSLSFFALKWIISEQNIAIINSIQREPGKCIVYASNLYSKRTLEDSGAKIKFVEKDYGVKHPKAQSYSSYFSFYTYYPSSGKIDNFPELNHVTSGGDKNIIKNRNASNIKFFLLDFLPERLLRLPIYVWLVYRYRLVQLINAWSRE